MLTDWDDVRFFLAAARAGSTLAASRALGVDQTTVARRLDRLEARTAHRFFVRRPGGRQLNALGREVLAQAEAAEAAVEAFLCRFAPGRAPLAGLVTIRTPGALLRPWILPAVDRVRGDLPAIEWRFVTGEGAPFDPEPELLEVHLSGPTPAPQRLYRAFPGATAPCWLAPPGVSGGQEGETQPARARIASLARLPLRRTASGATSPPAPVTFGSGEPDAPSHSRAGACTDVWISHPERGLAATVAERLIPALLDGLAEAVAAGVEPDGANPGCDAPVRLAA